MKALEQTTTPVTKKRVIYKKTDNYKYIGNTIINNIPKPKKAYFQYLNDDLYNVDLSSDEKIMLMILVSHKPNTEFNNKACAKKLCVQVDTVNDILEKLMRKLYIHITNDGNILILRTSKATKTPEMLSILTEKRTKAKENT